MAAYLLRRILLLIPTLVGIMVLNFVIINAAPGGPVEQVLARVKGTAVQATARIGGGGSEVGGGSATTAKPVESAGAGGKYHGASGIDPAFIKELERQFGFDKPAHERFFLMMKNFLRFDFGNSFFRDRSVVSLVVDKMPVSISLGVWTTLLVYLISIPLGIAKAVRDGSRFDVWTSGAVILGNAIPSFLFAILLIVVFAGGRYLDWFPLRGLVSDDWSSLSPGGKVVDYLWHITLPVLSMVIGGFAGLTMLTKNSFLDQINQQYVVTARAKGLSEWRLVMKYPVRLALNPLISTIGWYLPQLFSGSLIVATVMNLPNIGPLLLRALTQQDMYLAGSILLIYCFLTIVGTLISDILLAIFDPRIRMEGD